MGTEKHLSATKKLFGTKCHRVSKMCSLTWAWTCDPLKIYRLSFLTLHVFSPNKWTVILHPPTINQ
jgi:hypothetical protein